MNNDSFGLSSLRDGVKKRASELAHDSNARVRSYDDTGTVDRGPFKPFTFQQEDFDRTEPDNDALQKYWRQFETVPFVRKSITSFSRQVMEPGYYIQARGVDRETLRELDHWLNSAAIVEGEKEQDFRKLAKKAVVQQEVRGTAFVEKAPDGQDSDRLAGLKLINAETMEAVTRPGQSILLDPSDNEDHEGAPSAESGGAAAWLQDLGETETFFSTPVSGRNRGIEDNDVDDDFKIGFQRDEIIKMARDADAGELFGTSRLEAVSDRIEGLRNKLSDNDDAIASKAYPLWLFLFGSEDSPWEGDDIDEFMKSHEMSNFHAGMKQGVRGDISVETVSGEVAEIAESLQFDIEWIMSIMPIPKFALGAFTQDTAVGQFGGVAQQQETQRQIKDTRRDIEEKFTPVVQEVAQQFGVDEETAKNIRLKIGEPGQPEPEIPQRENIINYIPKDQRKPGQRDPNTQSPGNDGVPEIPNSVDEPFSDIVSDDSQGSGPAQEPAPSETPSAVSQSASARVWHETTQTFELSLSNDSALADAIYDAMVGARDQTLDRIESEFKDAPSYATTKFENVANSVLRQQMSRSRFRDRVQPAVEELIGSDEHSFTQSRDVRFYVQNVENATEDALEEMLRLMRIQIRRSSSGGSTWEQTRTRVENEYNDAKLRERAELIAQMESKNAKETTKLKEFESDPDIIGFRVVNDGPSTPLTRSLNGAEVYFGDGDIQGQLMDQTREQFLREGFDPIPPTPPFHYQDTTTIEPIHD